MNTSVLIFAAVVSLFTGLLFGLVPALQSTRAKLAGAMKNDAPSEKLRRLNLRDILVTTQVALSVVLLIGSVLVVRSLQHALSLRLGFEPQHAAALSYDLGLQGYDEPRGREFQRRLLDKLRSMPGIESAGRDRRAAAHAQYFQQLCLCGRQARAASRGGADGQYVRHHARLPRGDADAPDRRPRFRRSRHQRFAAGRPGE